MVGDIFSSKLNFKESLGASLAAAKEAVHQAGNRRWSNGPLIGNWQDKKRKGEREEMDKRKRYAGGDTRGNNREFAERSNQVR